MAQKRTVGRRDFLKYAGGAAAAAGAFGGTMAWRGGVLEPERVAAQTSYDLFFGGTDGMIWLPDSPPIPIPGSTTSFKHPDDIIESLALDRFPSDTVPRCNAYMFGFRNLTGMDATQVANQKFRAQHCAPLFWVDQYDPGADNTFIVRVTNLGLELRPDLFDAHTLHWHGFRNIIPFFDGEPTGSIAIPSSRIFDYAYRPRDPGTYMYHCHVEDTEHVHMGMTGLVFVRPSQNGNTTFDPSGKFLYNDNDGSTAYDREFALFLSEFWADSHWADSHIELPEWSDYRADFAMLNGRVYPDTLEPNGESLNPFRAIETPGDPGFNVNPGQPDDGDLIPILGLERLQYQPYSSLVTCNPGERVALRFANLGFIEAAMTLAGIDMTVVGRDATLMRGRDGTPGAYVTDTINIGAGESFDVVFTAPAFDSLAPTFTDGGGAYNRYLLYNRNAVMSNNRATGGLGGQATEVRVYQNPLAAQTIPNEWGF